MTGRETLNIQLLPETRFSEKPCEHIIKDSELFMFRRGHKDSLEIS